MPQRLGIRYVGGPTALLQVGGLRLLTDPTFDPPGEHPVGDRVLVKTAGPAVPPDGLGAVDAVLLSHDQHPDNLDTLGRTLLARVPLVLSTVSAEDRLGGNVRALPAWTGSSSPARTAGRSRSPGCRPSMGRTGASTWSGRSPGSSWAARTCPRCTSAATTPRSRWCGPSPTGSARWTWPSCSPGAARTALAAGAYLTLTSQAAAEAAKLLGARAVVPLHFEGWAHFTQGRDSLSAAFEDAGLADRLHLPEPGDPKELTA